MIVYLAVMGFGLPEAKRSKGEARPGHLWSVNKRNKYKYCLHKHTQSQTQRERERLSNYAARMPSAGFFVNSSKLAHTHSPTHTHIFSNQMTRIGGVWPRNRWWPIRVSLAHTIHQFERNVRFVRLAMIPFVQLLQLKPNQLTHIWLNGQSNYAQNKNFAQLNRQCSLRIERIFFFSKFSLLLGCSAAYTTCQAGFLVSTIQHSRSTQWIYELKWQIYTINSDSYRKFCPRSHECKRSACHSSRSPFVDEQHTHTRVQRQSSKRYKGDVEKTGNITAIQPLTKFWCVLLSSDIISVVHDLYCLHVIVIHGQSTSLFCGFTWQTCCNAFSHRLRRGWHFTILSTKNYKQFIWSIANGCQLFSNFHSSNQEEVQGGMRVMPPDLHRPISYACQHQGQKVKWTPITACVVGRCW